MPDREGSAVVPVLTAFLALPLAFGASVAACMVMEADDAGFARTALVAALAFSAVGAAVFLLLDAVVVAVGWWRERRAVRRRLRRLADPGVRVLPPLDGRWR